MEDSSTSTSEKYLKEELKSVINQMGPNSPDLCSDDHSNSERADNDSMVYAQFIKHHSVNLLNKFGSETEPSEPMKTTDDESARESTDISILNNVVTSPSDNLMDHDMSCECPHQYFPMVPNPVSVPGCCCAQQMVGCRYMNQQIIPMSPARPHKVLRDECTNLTCKAKTVGKSRGIIDWIKDKAYPTKDLYKMNVVKQGDDNQPKQFVFDLVNEKPTIPPLTMTTKTATKTPSKEVKNFKNEKMSKKEAIFNKPQKSTTFFDGYLQRRMDFYYFDHGNAQYFHTTDSPPVMICEIIAEKTENYTTKFWAELFGSIHIFFSFITSFILQLFRFILYSILRPLVIGIMQLASDYFLKPFLTTLFNAIIQPPLIFFYNIATSIRDLLDPVAEAIGYFIREIAVIIRAFRIISIRKNCDCEYCKKCPDFKEKQRCDC